VITVVAIILGEQYPFWLVPALVILIMIGTGTPGGTVQIILKNEKNSKKFKNTKNLKNEKNSKISKINTDENSKKIIGSLMSVPVAHFNHLINLSFDVQDLVQGSGKQFFSLYVYIYYYIFLQEKTHTMICSKIRLFLNNNVHMYIHICICIYTYILLLLSSRKTYTIICTKVRLSLYNNVSN
jgi:hypothetical protein